MDCSSYCEHGGVCVLPHGHAVQHNSRYCQWTDEQALSKKEADVRYLTKALAKGWNPDLVEFVRKST